MIKAVYDRKENKITVEGHAYSGEPGHDLICAAASVLIYTIAASVSNMQEREHVSDAVINLESGNGLVSCEPYEQFKGAITLIFDSICAGYELLAANYPSNVSYTINE
jgi:uncharacterized protein YsxB (DUF464 family)